MTSATAGVAVRGGAPRDIAEPFPRALRSAIAATGLSLDGLARRLARRGTPLSSATLSYWQSGRRRPERPDSLRALRALEAVLGVAPGDLCSLLGPPRPRGRAAHLAPPTALWEPGSAAAEVLSTMGSCDDAALARISHHDRCGIDEHGRLRSLHTRQLLRANESGVDRWVLVHEWGRTGRYRPELRGLRNCRPGRTVMHPGHGVLAAEILFDHPLATGETVLIEYELRAPEPAAAPPPRLGSHARRGRVPVRECLLEIDFPPQAIPTSCVHFRRPTGDRGTTRTEHLQPSPDGRVHALGLDLPPCEFGIGWRYDELRDTYY